MTSKQTSTTAKGIAAIRALESERPAEARICYDPLARAFTGTPFYLLSKWLAGYGDRVSPGTRGFIVCRCRYFDQYLEECLQGPISQVVILGAGLDSRAYRTEPKAKLVKFYEVDQPATQASKIERVRRFFGNVPDNPRFVAIDFNRESMDKLLETDYSLSEPTLFMWEGVTYYLSADAVDTTLEWIHGNAGAGSHLIFDYVYRESLTASRRQGDISRMQRYSHFTGEGMTFGIEKGTVEGFLSARGYTSIVNVEGDQLRDLYGKGPNKGLKVVGSYAVVHADVGSG